MLAFHPHQYGYLQQLIYRLRGWQITLGVKFNEWNFGVYLVLVFLVRCDSFERLKLEFSIIAEVIIYLKMATSISRSNCHVSGCSTTTGYCFPGVSTCQCRQGFVGFDCSESIYQTTQAMWSYFLFHLSFFSIVSLSLFVWSITEIFLLVSPLNSGVW